MRDKNLIITLSITFFLFTFISFLIYLIYCYVYYNPHQETLYANKFNHREYDFVYNHFENDSLSYEDFLIPIHIMYQKNYLHNIYTHYYANSNLSEEEFYQKYYYGDKLITKDQIIFNHTNKTTLLHRRQSKYKKIEVTNTKNIKSTIGILYNISIKIEPNATIEIDSKSVSCYNNACQIDKIYGGLHPITYKSNNITYYGLLNVKSDNSVIDVSLLDSLIKVPS